MHNLKLIARIFYGAGVAGIGVLHFFYPGFRPVILPIPPEATTQLNMLVYLTGVLLLITGLLIANCHGSCLHEPVYFLLMLIFKNGLLQRKKKVIH